MLKMPEVQLPKIGLGTWMLSMKDCKNAVSKAIEIGYRLIDTAQSYGNEKGVGDGIAEAITKGVVSRDDLVIATKINILNYAPFKVIKTANLSLEKLGLKKVDILYVHWPAKIFGYKAEKTLKAFSQLVDEGKVGNIGISNFNNLQLDTAINVCDGLGKKILAHQIEHHPMLQQREMRKLLADHDIYLVAYSPILRGNAGTVPELAQIAKKHGVSEAQVSLAWEMEHGAIPIPKATSETHIKDNFSAQDLVLDKEDIDLIDAIKVAKRFVNPPSFFHGGW
jgi:2,5-diketo-D-gluconate reductase B